jgi:hypothetical protein
LQKFAQELTGRGRRITSPRAAVRTEKFLAQAIERLAVVHVIPGGQEMHRQIDFPSALDCLFEDAVRAPIDSLEELTMEFFQTNEVIPAVIRRAEHDRVGGAGQKFYGFGEGLLRNRRAV